MRYIFYILLLLCTLSSALAQSDNYSSACENNKFDLEKDYETFVLRTRESGMDVLYAKISSRDAIAALFKSKGASGHCLHFVVQSPDESIMAKFVGFFYVGEVRVSYRCEKDDDRKGVLKCFLDENSFELILVYSDIDTHAVVVCNPKERKVGWVVVGENGYVKPGQQASIDGILAQLGLDKDDKVKVC